MAETASEKLPDAPVQSGGTVPTRQEHNYLLMAVRQAHAARLCPAGETPEQTYLKLQRARELGVPINSALAQLYVVNGRVATMGRLKLALVRKSGRYQYRFEPVDDPMRECKFTLWPKGSPEEAYTAHWTFERAQTRGLTGKGAWAKYADYMLRWRAVSEAVDLVAPDACDLPLVEELAHDFDLRGAGAVILQETDDVLPRVVDATTDMPQLSATGYTMPPEWHAKAVGLMKFLDYPEQEIAAQLDALTCDEDAKRLAARLQQERDEVTDAGAEEVGGGDGTPASAKGHNLFGDDAE